MEKETLCWGCQNYSKCSWAKGVPVENWEAIPTIIENATDNGINKIDSFLVLNCPQYEADKLQKTSLIQICKIINISKNTIYKRKKHNERLALKYVNDLLLQKGYKLHIYINITRDGKREFNTYYLEKLSEGGVNESN